MPPKKKGKGKKGKGKGGDKDLAADGPVAKDEPTEKEQELRKELEQLSEKLKAVKNEVEDLRKENEWLQEEAQQTRLESHEYMSYMSKKTQKRQTTIISLSDRNQQEIKDINEQKEELLKDFDQKKEALKLVMLEKEAELSRTKNELADLEEYQILQKDQEAEIERLENEVQTMRKKHSEAIQKLKSSFLREKRGFQKESESKIQEMAQQVTQEARQCLEEHTNNIKNDNKLLRRELLQLIRRTRALHEHREELEAQHNALLREIQYGRDLKKLHGTRQNRLWKTFGIDQDDHKQTTKDTSSKKDKLAILYKH